LIQTISKAKGKMSQIIVNSFFEANGK